VITADTWRSTSTSRLSHNVALTAAARTSRESISCHQHLSGKSSDNSGSRPKNAPYCPFRSVSAPFTDALNKLKWEGRHTFYDCSTVQRKFHNDHGLAVVDRKALGEYFVRCIFNLDDMTSHDISREDITVVRDRPPDFMMAHICVVFAPWLSSDLSHVEQGLYCTNCLYNRPNLLYTEETILEHLKDCRVGTTIWDWNNMIIFNMDNEEYLSLVLDAP
jgi:hypothetical protein